MKEITKKQMIGLMDSINREGIDNSRYTIVENCERCACSEKIACEDDSILEPGVYCVIYSDEPDFSDMPFLSKWIDENLTEDNIEILLSDETNILIICLAS